MNGRLWQRIERPRTVYDTFLGAITWCCNTRKLRNTAEIGDIETRPDTQSLYEFNWKKLVHSRETASGAAGSFSAISSACSENGYTENPRFRVGICEVDRQIPVNHVALQSPNSRQRDHHFLFARMLNHFEKCCTTSRMLNH